MSTFVEIQSAKQQQMLSDAASQQLQQQAADTGTLLRQATLDAADDSSSRT